MSWNLSLHRWEDLIHQEGGKNHWFAHSSNPAAEFSVFSGLGNVDETSHSDVGKGIQASCNKEHGSDHAGADSHDFGIENHDTSAELYAIYLNDFLEALVIGDYKKTSDKLKIFLDANGTKKITSLYKLKKNLHELNTFCKEKLLTILVHPYYPLDQSDEFERQIDSTSQYEALAALPYKTTRKYCMLVKNHMNSEYSGVIRSVISYIDQNVGGTLSLAVLAEEFHKNASFLSGRFSKETGMSPPVSIRRSIFFTTSIGRYTV